MTLNLLFFEAFKHSPFFAAVILNVFHLASLETIFEFKLFTGPVNLYVLRSCTNLTAVLQTAAHSNPSNLQTVWFHANSAATKQCPANED
jgi:hypothetical protein